MSFRLTYEHAMCRGVFLTHPRCILRIFHKSVEIGVFGFNVMSCTEVEDAIMNRATLLLNCTMVSPEIKDVTAKVEAIVDGEPVECEFCYNEKDYQFNEK